MTTKPRLVKVDKDVWLDTSAIVGIELDAPGIEGGDMRRLSVHLIGGQTVRLGYPGTIKNWPEFAAEMVRWANFGGGSA